MEHRRGAFKAGGRRELIAMQNKLCRKFRQKRKFAQKITDMPHWHTFGLLKFWAVGPQRTFDFGLFF
jgi:hypothetical protein